jgi:hypothetical protein
MPSFLTALVAKTTEVFSKEYWQKMFADNFGKTETVEYQNADEAFFKLMEMGDHEFITSVILTNPSAFCRAAKLKTFFTGQSVEKHKNGDQLVVTEHTYVPAPFELASKVGEAVAGVLMERLEVLGRSHQNVGRNFWILDPSKDGYQKDTAKVAGDLQSMMHSLLNIAEGLGDREGFEQIAMLCNKMFGGLPPSVFFRVREVLRPPVAVPSTPREPMIVDGANQRRDRKGKKTRPANDEATPEEIRAYRQRQRQLDEEGVTKHTLQEALQEATA